MNKKDFLDIIFSAAWISIFISAVITMVIYFLFRQSNIILLAIIIEAVVMYFACRFLYSRRIDS